MRGKVAQARAWRCESTCNDFSEYPFASWWSGHFQISLLEVSHGELLSRHGFSYTFTLFFHLCPWKARNRELGVKNHKCLG